MPSLAGSVQVFGQEIFSSSATPAHQVGAIGLGSDGRVYRYAKAGLADLVVGNALQSRGETASLGGHICRVTAAGASYVLITAGAAMTANELAGGLCVVDTGPGVGFAYKIAGHRAIAGAAAGQLDLDQEVVQVGVTASSEVKLIANPYNGVIQHPVTTATGVCVGGAVYPILAGQYGWVQTGGPGAGLIAGTPAKGQPLTSVGTPAGSLTVHTAELNHVAWAMCDTVAGRVMPVWWIIN
jgi:hypothetical protein